MSAKKLTAAEQLVALEKAVVAAEERRDEVKAEQRKAFAEFQMAKGALLDAETRRSAGKGSDQDVAEAEEALSEAAKIADVRLRPPPVRVNRQGDDPEARIQVGEEAYDANLGLWAARITGAEQAIVEAEEERDQFGRSHFAEIAAEEFGRDSAARDAFATAWAAVDAAANEYAGRARRWHHLARYGGYQAETIPNGAPLRGDARVAEVRAALKDLPLPTPPSLL